MDLVGRVAATIERHGMIERGQLVGVAVSGGADSVCLLHMLRELSFRMVVLHLNHGLRGDESDQDEHYVKDLSRSLQLECITARASLPTTGNLEQEARRARAAFFTTAMVDHHLDRVAVGHTRSDQAETVFYRFLRGAGTAGLSGILPVTREGIVRPLLDVDRTEVESYLRERGIAWRQDSSNSSLRFVRNRIRHEILPSVTANCNANLHAVLAHTAEWAAGEEAFWEAELDRLEPAILETGNREIFLLIEPLALLPLAAQRRMVRRAIHRAKGDLRGVNFGHIEAILALTGLAKGHGQVAVPGLSVRRSFGRIRLAARESLRKSVDYELPVEVPGSLQIPGTTKEILLQLVDPKEYNEGMGCLDWRRLSGSLKLRSWRDGDRYWPAGSTGEEKIKILFQNARIPVWERRGWPILTAGGAIIWAGQFGPAAQYAADSHSSLVLRILEING